MCDSFTTEVRRDKRPASSRQETMHLMSETQRTTIARLEERLESLKERL
jgi:hypothetical protein